MEDIFDLAKSNKEKDFVKKGLSLELDIMADVTDVFCGIPYVGSLIKLGILANRYQDLRFIRNLARFLEKEQEIPMKEKRIFLENLDTKKRQTMYEYLTHYLLNAEDDTKADIMGYIYKERVFGRIDDDMFLRLCSVINRIFVRDLKHLNNYIEPQNKTDYVTNNLYSCGLLDYKTGSVHGESINIGGEYTLNIVGKKLCEILNAENWMDESV